jgi:hypothetical protein
MEAVADVEAKQNKTRPSSYIAHYGWEFSSSILSFNTVLEASKEPARRKPRLHHI